MILLWQACLMIALIGNGALWACSHAGPQLPTLAGAAPVEFGHVDEIDDDKNVYRFFDSGVAA